MSANLQISSDMAKSYVDYAQSVIAGNERKSDIKIFNNPLFGEIRVITDEQGNPQFCLSDLCQALDLTAKGVRQRLDDEVISNYPITDSIGREQSAIFVNEDGMYDTILDSRKAEAKKFRKWITSEVLPSIRKTGTYSLSHTIPSNPQLQTIQAQFYIADMLSERLRLNDASRLGMYQSIAAPYNLAIPQYVPSQGVLKSASDLLKENGYPMSAIKFNMLLTERGYLETLTRPTSGGAVKKFKSITAKGKPYGENQVSPKNQKETQPQWYADRFGELYNIVTA